MRILLLLIAFVLTPMNASADFGSRPIDWSNLQSEDFRDYAIRTFNRQNSVLNNYWVHYWLQQKVLELNLVTPSPIGPTIPLVINKNTINAFAIPGNIIGIHSGLWESADSESEFISVLAHEMAHISLDHFSRLGDNADNQTWVVAGGILLSLLFSQENPELANATLISTLASTAQNQLNFSRAMEIEADQLAQTIMINGQYDVEAGRVFFQKLSGGSSDNDAYEFLRTHPLGNTRSSNLSGQTASVVNKEEPLFKALKAQIQNTPYTFNPANSNTITDDPNLIYASILVGIKNKISSNSLEQLRDLVLNYPSFLPGLAHYLSSLHQSQSDELCAVMDIADKRFKNEFLTLDVLQTLKSAANQCSHASAQYWHSQLLWQSGKEPEALAFLSKSLNLERDTNKAARLKSRLQLLTERYERFR